MARYNVQLRRTASTTLSVGSINAAASAPQRVRIYAFTLGHDGTPGDLAFLWQFQASTTLGTRTAVTPTPKDPADAASIAVAGENHTVDPTLTGSTFYHSVAINSRVTYRWFAVDNEDELIIPANANVGIAIRTPVATGLIAITASLDIKG